MTQPQIPLILAEESVPWIKLGGRPPVRPGTTVVFSTNQGEVVWLQGRMDYLTAAANYKYRMQYTVDIADHEHDLAVPNERVASADPLFTFGITGHVGWRVTQPDEIVRRQVRDGLALVRSRMIDMVRDITIRYSMDQINQAQTAIGLHFAGKDLELREGITVYRCSPVLSPDQHYIETRRTVDVKNLMDRAINGERDVLLLHLASNPGATHSVLEQLGSAQKASVELKLELIKAMMDNGYLQNVDVDGLRDDTIRDLIATVRSGVKHGNPMLSAAAQPATAIEASSQPSSAQPFSPRHSRSYANGGDSPSSQPDNVTGWRIPDQPSGNGARDREEKP